MWNNLNVKFTASIQKDFNSQPKLHKMVYLTHIASNSLTFKMDSIIEFLEILPFSFTTSKGTNNKKTSVYQYNISCSFCRKKIFHILMYSQRPVGTIQFSAKCEHIRLVKISQDGYVVSYSIDVFSMNNSPKSINHPFRKIGKRIIKFPSCSQVLKKYL